MTKKEILQIKPGTILWNSSGRDTIYSGLFTENDVKNLREFDQPHWWEDWHLTKFTARIYNRLGI